MNKLLFMTSKKILLLLSILFLWTCGGGGSSSPTEPVEPAPVSNFTATPTSGLQPLEVVFTSTATGTISSYAWNVDADTDIEGTAATFTHTYTDAGTYGVTLTVTGPGGSNPKTVADMITVTSAAPTPSTETSQTTQEEESITFALSATDPNSESVTFAIFSQPSYGQASINGSDLTYTPNENFYGIDTLEYTASNSNYTSNPAQINITVTGTDDGDPTSNNVTVSTNEDISVVIDLDATEIDGDNYSFAIIGQPTNGTLGSISGSQVEYTPNQDWNGTDTFTFEATDDRFSRRNVATATITVNATNDAPQANDISVELDENRNSTHLLNENNDFIENEKATINSRNISKNLNENSLKDNSFSNNINNAFDGTKESSSVNTRFKPVTITLDATDVEGDALSYAIVSSISNGTLEGVSSNSVKYTPDQDFNGTDTFTYLANDGNLDSNVATVTITINAVNDAPVTDDISTTTDEDNVLTGDLSNFISDIDGDNLTLIAATNPANGSATFSGTQLTYTPNQDYNGTDSFTYKVNDGELDSNTSTITITINPVNDAPISENITVSAYKNTPVEFDLDATDVDGDAIDWGFGTTPANGTLEWADESAGTLRYTPDQDFSGTDSFEYYAGDPLVWGNGSIVTINVSSNIEPPSLNKTTFALPYVGYNTNYPPSAENFDIMTISRLYLKNHWNNPTPSYGGLDASLYYVEFRSVPDASGDNGTLPAVGNSGKVSSNFWSQSNFDNLLFLDQYPVNNGVNDVNNMGQEWYFFVESCYGEYTTTTDGGTIIGSQDISCSDPQRVTIQFVNISLENNTLGTVVPDGTDQGKRFYEVWGGGDLNVVIDNYEFNDPTISVRWDIKKVGSPNTIAASGSYLPTTATTELDITIPQGDSVPGGQYYFQVYYDPVTSGSYSFTSERFSVNQGPTANIAVTFEDPNATQYWTLIDKFNVAFDWDPSESPYIDNTPPSQARMRVMETNVDGGGNDMERYVTTVDFSLNMLFDPSTDINFQNALHDRNCQGQIAIPGEADCWNTRIVFDFPDDKPQYAPIDVPISNYDTSWMSIGWTGTDGGGNFFYDENQNLYVKDGMRDIRFIVQEGGIPSDGATAGRKLTFAQGELLETVSVVYLSDGDGGDDYNQTYTYGAYMPRELDVENKNNGGDTLWLPVNGTAGGASKNFKSFNVTVSVSDNEGIVESASSEMVYLAGDTFGFRMVKEFNDDHIVTAGFCNLPGNGGPDNTVFIPGQRYNLCVSFGDAFYRPALRIVDTTNNDAVMWQKSYTYLEMMNGEGASPYDGIFQLYFTLPTDVFTEEQQHGKYRLELYDDYDSNPNLWGYGPKNNGSGVHTTGTTATTTDFVIRSSE